MRRVGGPLQHHAEWSGADRARDVARQPSAVARLHEDRRVLGDRVLRVRYRAGPEWVWPLDDEGGGSAHQADAAPRRPAVGHHHADQRVAVPAGNECQAARAGEHHRIAVGGDRPDLEHRLTGTAADRSGKSRVGAGEVGEPDPAPPLETGEWRRTARDVGIPVAGHGGRTAPRRTCRRGEYGGRGEYPQIVHVHQSYRGLTLTF